MSKNGQSEKIPPGWTTALLSDVVEPRGGKANPQDFPDERFIGMEQVEPHTMKLLGTVPCSLMKSAGNRFFPTDVLYGRLRSYLNKVFQPDFSGLCSGEFIVLPESTALVGRFLKYRLNSADFVSFATHINSGDRPRVDFDQIKVFPLWLPPRREQERIADALDELLSDLDAGIEELHQVRKKLNHYRASILKAAVEGTLTAEWRAQHPNTEPASVLLKRILAERRRHWEEEQLRKFNEQEKEPPNNWRTKYKEPITSDSTEISLPQGWCWSTLDQIADIAGGVTKGQKFSSADETRVVPYLRVANVQRGYLDLSEIKEIRARLTDIEALTLKPGDVLFNEGGDRDKLGRGWVWNGEVDGCIHQNHVFRARLFLPDIQPKFVSWCGNSYGQRWFSQTGKQSVNLASINLTVLRSFPVPLPPAAEQEIIVETIEDQFSVIDHLERDLESRLKTSQSLRQSILRHAFEGKLVPQDPNDEPASELLKRIAIEREERAREAAAAKAATTKSKKSRKQVRAAKT